MEREPDPRLRSIDDIFGFFVRDDGQVQVQLKHGDKTVTYSMAAHVAETIGHQFMNAAAQAMATLKATRAARAGQVYIPPLPTDPTLPRAPRVANEKAPEKPPTWGKSDRKKTPDKPN